VTAQPPSYNNGGSTFDQGGVPTPELPNNANVPEQRVQRPPINNGAPGNGGPAAGSGEGSLLNNDAGGEQATPAESDDTTSWWGTPPYFDTQDRSARRVAPKGPTAPVWNAVYRKQAGSSVQRTAYRQPSQPAPRQLQSSQRQRTQRQRTQQQRTQRQRTQPQRHKQVGASGWRSAD